MKKILLILACAIIPVLSYAQEENKCCNDETATVNEVPNLVPPESLMEFLENEQDCQKDSVSFYEYDIVANPDNIFEEVQSMYERQTPMGITIMLLGLLLLLSLVIFVIAYVVRLIIICISNNRNIKK